MLTAMFVVSSIETINFNPGLDGRDYPMFKKGITFILFPNEKLKEEFIDDESRYLQYQVFLFISTSKLS